MEESLGSDPKGLTLLKSRISFLITYQEINFYLDKKKEQIVIKWEKKIQDWNLATLEGVCGKDGKAIQGSINESNNVKNDDITKNKLLATLGLYKKNPLN